jgi:hypothetical protein
MPDIYQAGARHELIQVKVRPDTCRRSSQPVLVQVGISRFVPGETLTPAETP